MKKYHPQRITLLILASRRGVDSSDAELSPTACRLIKNKLHKRAGKTGEANVA
jgi:hypothetical protein